MLEAFPYLRLHPSRLLYLFFHFQSSSQWRNIRHAKFVTDLDVYKLVIPADSLLKGVANHCEACSIIEKGILHFTKSFDAIATFQLLVDCSLYITLIDKDKKRLATIEFYTHNSKIILL